jgi:putative transcriptional regulator
MSSRDAPSTQQAPVRTGRIGNRIRRLRFDHNEMTQEALALAVGITRQTVIALEAERYAPSLDLAMKLADVFGARVDDVFFRHDEPRDERHGGGNK